MNAGQCVLMPTPGNQTAHLWIVVTNTDVAGLCVIVNVTTLRHICDKTVILHVGEHPFITHDSIVLYADAQIVRSSAIEAALRGGAAQGKPPCSPGVLARVVAGIAASPDTPFKVQQFCAPKQST
jgi:hypothetical protein